MDGGGGHVEDTDCSYSYVLRDSTSLGGQACWNWCSKYVTDGAQSCAARSLLADGAEIYCAYKLFSSVSGHPHPGPCHIFIGKDVQITGPGSSDGGENWEAYAGFYMSDTACRVNLTETCSFSPEEACEATDIPISDVQASCSQAHAFESDFYWDCVTDLCLTNDTEWIQPDLPSMPSLPAFVPPYPPSQPPLFPPPMAPSLDCAQVVATSRCGGVQESICPLGFEVRSMHECNMLAASLAVRPYSAGEGKHLAAPAYVNGQIPGYPGWMTSNKWPDKCTNRPLMS